MIEVYTDAASRGNPGESGIGIIIKIGREYERHSYFIGEWTNHEAEFHAVIKALEICVEKFPDDVLSFRTDSKVVVDTIENNHTKNEKFLPLLKRIRQLSSCFPLFFIKWIPDKENKQADRLAKEAIWSKND